MAPNLAVSQHVLICDMIVSKSLVAVSVPSNIFVQTFVASALPELPPMAVDVLNPSLRRC